MWYDNYCNNSSCWSTTTIRRNPTDHFPLKCNNHIRNPVGRSFTIFREGTMAQSYALFRHIRTSNLQILQTAVNMRHGPTSTTTRVWSWMRLRAWKLVSARFWRVNKTTPGASSSERLEHQVPGDWLPQTICQVDSSSSSEELMERSTSRNSTILQRISICRARRSTNFTIKYWTVYVQIFVKILPIIRIVCSTLRFGANLRSTDDGIHLELQRITTTSKRWWWIITFFKDARFYTVSTTTSADTDQTQRCIRHARIAGLENIFVQELRCWVIQQQNWWGCDSSRVLRFYIVCWTLKSRSIQ